MKAKISIVLFVLAFVVTACVTTGNFDLNAVAAAAGDLMPENGPEEFFLVDLSQSKGNPERLLEYLRQARDSNACLALGAPELEIVLGQLSQALELAKSESFNGLYLIIVAERMDPLSVDQIIQDRGIVATYGVYK